MQNTELLLKELTLKKMRAAFRRGNLQNAGMPEHGIPQIWLSDGPHGLRKQAGRATTWG